MSALKAFLEDFERPSASGAASAMLAPVAPDSQSHAEEEARRKALDESYARGYAAGEAAAAEQARLDQSALDSAAAQLSTALDGLSADIKVQFCEALKTAVERVFPTLAEHGFADSCAAAVAKAAGLAGADAASQEGGARVTLKAAPSQAGLLEEAFARLGEDGAIRIETDAGLADLEIRAVWDNAGLDLNIEEAIRQAGEALDHTIAQIKDRT